MTPEEMVATSGDSAWMLMSAALVLLMTPALALFYGGMSRQKSALNMMMMSFGTLGLIGVIYVLWGWSMSYGTESVAGIFSNPFEFFGLKDSITDADGNYIAGAEGYPNIIDIGFQLTFAVITVAIIAGSVANRVKFSTWLVFAGIWVTICYFTLAHLVWGGGLLADGEDSLAAWMFGTAVEDGETVAAITPIDFAGGTVVHINAGVAALVLALIIGRSRTFMTAASRPHNLPLVMLGAALLWFGWFGFNGGAATTIEQGGLIWINTLAAPAAGMITWIMIERLRASRPSSIGSVSGAIAGLVAITPACANVDPYAAVLIGVAAGAGAFFAVEAKNRLRYDDALDVVAVHLVAGIIGTVMIGFFAFPHEDGPAGLLYGGGFELLIAQVLACLVAIVFAGLVTLAISLVLRSTMGLRIDPREELEGIDTFEHAEQAYSFR